jgi:hypothetical protein
LERRIRIFPIGYKIAVSSRSLSTNFCRIWQEQKSEFFHRNANAFALHLARARRVQISVCLFHLGYWLGVGPFDVAPQQSRSATSFPADTAKGENGKEVTKSLFTADGIRAFPFSETRVLERCYQHKNVVPMVGPGAHVQLLHTCTCAASAGVAALSRLLPASSNRQ